MKNNIIAKLLASTLILALVGCQWGSEPTQAETTSIPSLKKENLEVSEKFDAQVSSISFRHRRAMKTALAATMRLSGGDGSTSQVDHIQYRFVDLPKHSQIRAEGTVHFIDDWQGESGFGKMIEFGAGPLDPVYTLEVTLINVEGKVLASSQKFEVKVEIEENEELVEIGEIELIAMNATEDGRGQFINVDVDISLSSSKVETPKVLINITAVNEKSANIKPEPTCDMTLSIGICLGKATAEGNAIGSAYTVDVIALDEQGNTLAKSSQEVVVKPVLNISDFKIEYLGRGIYQYSVETKYTSSHKLDQKSGIQLEVGNEEGTCSLTTDLNLDSDDGTTITTKFLKRGPRKRGYRPRSGTLTINIYDSGSSLIIPPSTNETTIVDISAELTRTDLREFGSALRQQNKNGVSPSCAGRGVCLRGRCF